MSTSLLQSTPLTVICAHRDGALAKMDQAMALIAEGHRLVDEAQVMAEGAHGGTPFTMNDRAGTEAYQRIFQRINPEVSGKMYRHHLDARVWMHLLAITGMSSLMDKTAKDQLYKDLCGEVPEVSEESVRQMFEHLAGDASLIFQRGLARVFSDLDRRFRSHDGFKIGSRIILTNVFNSWGGWNYSSRMDDTMADVERVFAVLDGQPPVPYALRDAINADRNRSGMNPHQSVTETRYFRVRGYMNGNAHLWFKRDDLVEKANKMLADYYGAVLADAVPETGPEIRSKAGLPAVNLSFYATPQPVVDALLRDIYVQKGTTVLEPSAGTGSIARALLEKGATVDAIEIDASRAAILRTIQGLNVSEANFLQKPAVAHYDFVVMNPPFYGTHWMQHVVHAFDFLAPGGTLVVVLPIMAELGETAKHLAFRKWALPRCPYNQLSFHDLPPESFASSGTRINTVILTLRKDR